MMTQTLRLNRLDDAFSTYLNKRGVLITWLDRMGAASATAVNMMSQKPLTQPQLRLLKDGINNSDTLRNLNALDMADPRSSDYMATFIGALRYLTYDLACLGPISHPKSLAAVQTINRELFEIATTQKEIQADLADYIEDHTLPRFYQIVLLTVNHANELMADLPWVDYPGKLSNVGMDFIELVFSLGELYFGQRGAMTFDMTEKYQNWLDEILSRVQLAGDQHLTPAVQKQMIEAHIAKVKDQLDFYTV
ncbi:hypothetical protein ACFQ5M_02870 [Agrilactobacillus yilanensis]|uniref:Uncharacterized protein n=1 Tax=Agrilactobacillus yilanensis TaxID=2485997 RepID=A0ABW4J4C1_9LACO|nr:hypothetical protein [Agrilactobacillus yilanensis]